MMIQVIWWYRSLNQYTWSPTSVVVFPVYLDGLTAGWRRRPLHQYTMCPTSVVVFPVYLDGADMHSDNAGDYISIHGVLQVLLSTLIWPTCTVTMQATTSVYMVSYKCCYLPWYGQHARWQCRRLHQYTWCPTSVVIYLDMANMHGDNAGDYISIHGALQVLLFTLMGPTWTVTMQAMTSTIHCG